MNYESAVRYLLSLGRELAAPTHAAAAKFDLENITVLADRLGHPEHAYPSVHIAGTNGKGSTAAFLESVLRHAGFRTGLNTSPHLEKINERIRINGDEIIDTAFADTFTRIHLLIEELLAVGKLRAHPTYFECVTAMAFEYFARASVEFAVIEVGLGGRLDATNILSSVVTIITRIDFDHENFLGHSLKEIASEKAGILKPGVPLVLAEQPPEAREVILARAGELACPVIEPAQLFCVDQKSVRNGFARARITEAGSGKNFEIAPSLPGRFQLQNALNAVAAARVLEDRGFLIPENAIARGIANTVWPGRLEKLQSAPDIYCDGAHNPGAARELAYFLEQNFSGRKIFLIYAALRDKAVDEVAGLLFPHAAEVIFTAPHTTRAVSAAQLAEIAGHHASRFSVIPDAERAFEYTLAEVTPEDAIFITGSLYLVGQLRHYWKSRVRVHAR
jgi:dihydrofolate synthase/folylpolyglutamate synthase